MTEVCIQYGYTVVHLGVLRGLYSWAFTTKSTRMDGEEWLTDLL